MNKHLTPTRMAIAKELTPAQAQARRMRWAQDRLNEGINALHKKAVARRKKAKRHQRRTAR